MEFTNEIFFNKPLKAESTVIITYCGKLYREHSKDVSIVYGYGSDWRETDTALMTETDNGFEVTLTIKNYNTFNFCFTNSFNIWDNNFGFNYISPIEPKQENSINEISSSSSSIVENVDENLEEDTVEENDAQVESTEESNSANFERTNQDIEKAFASLLDSILDETTDNNETIDISNLSGFGLQSVDEINEEDMINCDEIFAELFAELSLEKEQENEQTIDINQNSMNLSETITQNENISSYEEINQDTNTPKEVKLTEYADYDAEELNALMDNLLNSISESYKSNSSSDSNQNFEEPDLSNEKVGLPALHSKDTEDWVDKIINMSYTFGKKVSTVFKKFGDLLKLKVKEFSSNEK